MIVKLSNNIDELNNRLIELEKDSSIKSIIFFATYETDLYKSFSSVDLSFLTKIYCGGFFPKVIFDKRPEDNAIVTIGLPYEMNVQVISDLSKEIELENEVESLNFDEREENSVFIIVDAFSKRLEEMITSVFNTYGSGINYFGGGAGHLDFKQRPCVFTRKTGLVKDAAIFASFKKEIDVVIKHGWDEFSGPFRVTKSNENIISEIDFKPAFNFYKEVIELQSNDRFSKNNFFDVAKSYPLGIPKLNSEVVVRDLLDVSENGELICIAKIEQNSSIYILKGTSASLINSANKVGQKFKKTVVENSTLFLMDCVSRAMFLEENFEKELAAIGNNCDKLIGVLALGEISNNGEDFLEFFNKTTLVCGFKK